MNTTQRTVRLVLAEPLRISRSTMTSRDAVCLTVEHEGLSGHGEAVTSVFYGLDTRTLQRLLAQAAGRLARFAGPETALHALRVGDLATDGTPAAVTAAVEAALLDLVGKRTATAVHRFLGAPVAPRAATARTVSLTSPGRAAAQARRLADAGFSVIKIKAGDRDEDADLDRVRAVRAAAPAARLLLDPNGAWSAGQARTLLPRFAALGIEAVEQPLAPGDPEALARLAARSPVPVIADEDAVTYADAQRLAGRVHGINVKLAKCGGVHAALRIAALIDGSGTDLMLGCLTASTLGIAPAVHIADRARWVDLDGHLLLAHDPWTGIGGADGFVGTTGQPGLGVRPRAAAGPGASAGAAADGPDGGRVAQHRGVAS
ncbi:enolase C-terminal domain-like protein [Streptomyces sp. B1I3]|uniref:enolase C-terminal domain-like protein n=1 Tax=Streptomyces sp. B1I3 TaxID=3042264 RepID=UPI0027864740|nr:enolase C-terminal domain-like protein [Streptomyces sp. B1I3]MDQ0792496.1 L-alanine-DL-glutamate epimerase-like enolase superfamily enzyme [Streptomyces sp. B1I3]